MKNKRVIILVFVLLAVIQLIVPLRMIISSERVLDEGVSYRFRMVPIDPSDPFRGRYITLKYRDNSVKISDGDQWKRGDKVFAVLSTHKEGYAIIKNISKIRPQDNEDYITAKIRYVKLRDKNTVTLDFPFTRYYMEEFKAPKAEKAYRKLVRNANTYALVSVQRGEAVIEDVLLDGVPIADKLNELLQEKEIR